MKKRPDSISIIGWYMIVSAIFSFFSIAISLYMPMSREILKMNPVPIPVQILIGFLSAAFSLITGFFMLKGKNWTRWFYLIWMSCSLIYSVFASPMKFLLIPGLLIVILILYFLFRPTASAYFLYEEDTNVSAGA